MAAKKKMNADVRRKVTRAEAVKETLDAMQRWMELRLTVYIQRNELTNLDQIVSRRLDLIEQKLSHFDGGYAAGYKAGIAASTAKPRKRAARS